MTYTIRVGFVLLVAVDTAAQICIKCAGIRIAAFDLTTAWFLRAVSEPLLHLVLLLFPVAFLIYMNLLKYAPVGPVYAAAHAHIVTVLVVSVLYFGERLTALQVLGALLILSGVIILGTTERGENA
jgi:drug/metabolite transporter (DMT)-like permease